jgi:O-antigen biosynthesis protein
MKGLSDWRNKPVNGHGPYPSRLPVISVLTCVYHGTPARYFEEAWQSLRLQEYAGIEWVVLAQGPVPAEIEATLQKIARDCWVRVLRLAENRGIIRGLRHCLDYATGEYVMVMDADDLLAPEALRSVGKNAIRHSRPSILYSDEDHYVNGQPAAAYIRPNWDPVLALSSSYIWHVCAFRRERAMELGVYSEVEAEWCQDWDTVLRFLQAGDHIVHIPEILYHWRAHEASSTNRPDPESGSLKSQRFVLNRFIRTKLDPELFAVREFPLFRGTTEYWLNRLRKEPARLSLLIYGSHPGRSAAAACTLLRNSGYRFESVNFVGVEIPPGDQARVCDLAGRQQQEVRLRCWPGARPTDLGRILADTTAESVVVCSDRVHVQGEEWPWECDGMFRCHPDLAIVAGRVLAADSTLVGGSEILGFAGLSGCPDQGRRGDDPGYFALALKPRSVSAPYSELFTARTAVLREFAGALEDASWNSIGCWLGALAMERKKRIAVTPLFNGVLQGSSRWHMEPGESRVFTERFGSLLPDTRWYSPRFGWRRETAYSLQPISST